MRIRNSDISICHSKAERRWALCLARKLESLGFSVRRRHYSSVSAPPTVEEFSDFYACVFVHASRSGAASALNMMQCALDAGCRVVAVVPPRKNRLERRRLDAELREYAPSAGAIFFDSLRDTSAMTKLISRIHSVEEMKCSLWNRDALLLADTIINDRGPQTFDASWNQTVRSGTAILSNLRSKLDSALAAVSSQEREDESQTSCTWCVGGVQSAAPPHVDGAFEGLEQNSLRVVRSLPDRATAWLHVLVTKSSQPWAYEAFCSHARPPEFGDSQGSGGLADRQLAKQRRAVASYINTSVLELPSWNQVRSSGIGAYLASLASHIVFKGIRDPQDKFSVTQRQIISSVLDHSLLESLDEHVLQLQATDAFVRQGFGAVERERSSEQSRSARAIPKNLRALYGLLTSNDLRPSDVLFVTSQGPTFSRPSAGDGFASRSERRLPRRRVPLSVVVVSCNALFAVHLWRRFTKSLDFASKRPESFHRITSDSFLELYWVDANRLDGLQTFSEFLRTSEPRELWTVIDTKAGSRRSSDEGHAWTDYHETFVDQVPGGEERAWVTSSYGNKASPSRVRVRPATSETLDALAEAMGLRDSESRRATATEEHGDACIIAQQKNVGLVVWPTTRSDQASKAAARQLNAAWQLSLVPLRVDTGPGERAHCVGRRWAT